MKIMKTIENVKRSIFPPCPKCPYTLGLVKCDPVSPCKMCKLDNYSTYDSLVEQANRNRPRKLPEEM